MTDQQSVDDIAMLLMQNPGVTFAQGFASGSDDKVRIRFRCNEFASLKEISSCAVAANVLIEVGDPNSRLCGEADCATDLPFDVTIEDDIQPWNPPTTAQIFGVFLARNLKKRHLLDGEEADRLQRGWNALPM